MLRRLSVAGKPRPLRNAAFSSRRDGAPASVIDCEPLAREFPSLEISPMDPGAFEPFVNVDAASWRAPMFACRELDDEIGELDRAGDFTVRVEGEADDVVDAAVEVMTRYQRMLGRRNRASRGRFFDAVLERHRAGFDLARPSERARFDGALDTWQWTLRLCPDAPLAAQIVALFGDDERDDGSRADRAEAALAGALRSARANASSCAMPDLGLGELDRMRRLFRLESAPDDAARPVLGDARALSFFSLGGGPYLFEHGAEATQEKASSHFRRLRPSSRFYIATVRHEPVIDELLYRLMTEQKSRAARR